MSRVHTIREKDDFNHLMERSSHHYVVIDFCAEWCRPCKKIAPIFECLSEKYHNVVFGRMDTDKIPVIAEGEKICSLPTFIVYKCGEQVKRLEEASESKLRHMLETLS